MIRCKTKLLLGRKGANMNCGSCKCYICGHPHCQRRLCRGERSETCRWSKEDCGRFIFDSEKLRDALLGQKEVAEHE